MANIEAKVIVDVKKDGKTSSNKSNSMENALNRQKDFNKEASKSTSIVDKLGNVLKKSAPIAWIISIKEATESLIKLTERQSEYVENLNMMKVAFGDTKDEAQSFIQELTNAIGLDPSGLTKQIGVYRQIADAMGYTAEVSDLLSQNLAKMQLDISSLFNLEFQQAGNALESAITGQVKTIRSLTGADITEATLKQHALALGIDKSVESMTRAEKTILIYLSLEKQLSNANGDLANTINSVSNQTKIFKEQITTAARQIGGLFIPILKQVLPLLNGILMAFNTLVSMLLTLFGIDANSLASEFGMTSGGLEDIEENLNGIDNASKSAKKSLRGFDKLNNITTPSKTSGVGGSGVGGVDKSLYEALKEYNLQLEEMKNKATKIRDRILEWLGFSKDVNDEWKWSAGDLLKNIFDWWLKLNGVAKIFVTLGVASAVVKTATGFKKLYDSVKKTKLATELSKILKILDKKGLPEALKKANKEFGGFAKTVGTLIGIAGVADGVVKFSDAIDTLVSGAGDVWTWVEAALALAEVIGGIMITIGALTGASGISLLVEGLGILAIAFGGDLLANITKGRDTTKDWVDKVWELTKADEEHIAQAEARASRAEEVFGELGALYDENGKIAKKSYDEASQKLDSLNSLLGTEYQLTKDGIIKLGEKEQSYDDLKKAVDNYCAGLRTEAWLEVNKEKYDKALEERIKKQEKYNKKHDELVEIFKELENKSGIEALNFINNNKEKIKALAILDGELQTNSQKISNYEKAATEASKGNYEEAVRLTTQAMEDITVTFDEKLQGLMKEAGVYTDELMTQLEKVDGFNASVSVEVQLKPENWKKRLEDTVKQYDKILKPETKYEAPRSLQYKSGAKSWFNFKADGGFVDTGDIFVANERGPEFVGSIGNKTAVANQDQIVESISIGVAKAMMSSQRKTDVNIIAEGDTSGLLNFITFKQKEQDRQYGLG